MARGCEGASETREILGVLAPSRRLTGYSE